MYTCCKTGLLRIVENCNFVRGKLQCPELSERGQCAFNVLYTVYTAMVSYSECFHQVYLASCIMCQTMYQTAMSQQNQPCHALLQTVPSYTPLQSQMGVAVFFHGAQPVYSSIAIISLHNWLSCPPLTILSLQHGSCFENKNSPGLISCVLNLSRSC